MCHAFARLLILLMLVATVGSAQSVVRTIAGTSTLGAPFTGEGGAAYGTAIGTPWSVCADTNGNIYYADYHNKVVKKISRNGILTTIAGNGAPSSVSNPDENGDGGPATASRVIPQTIAIDKKGSLYIGDVGTATVRKITTGGIITTVAGNRGVIVVGGDGGPATAAGLGGVSGIAFDKVGNMFLACGNVKLRKVDTNGIISTVVNVAGVMGTLGDGGPATAAATGPIQDVAFDSTGNMYFAAVDENTHVVRKVTPGGIISRFAGLPTGIGSTGDGGAATLAKLSSPNGIEVDHLGNVYISESNRIRVVNTSGIISTYAGATGAGYAGDGAAPGNTTRFNPPMQLCFDKRHFMYIPDRGATSGTSTSGRRIRQIFQRDTFDISVSPSALLCGNTSATFTAHTPNAYYSYVYRWYVNGLLVGSNAPVYSSAMVHNNDAVTCTIVDTASGGMILATSDTIHMTVLPPVNPHLAVASTGDTVCLGLPITFNATAINGGASPTFRWFVFGSPYATGPTFTYTPLVGQIVSVVLTSSDPCAVPTTDTVHRALSVIPSFHPHAEITASPDSNLAHWGQIITFFCEITYGGPGPTFQWYNSAGPIPGATSQTYFQEMYAPDLYYCVVHSNGYCAVPGMDTSNTVQINTGQLGVTSTTAPGSGYVLYPNPNSGAFTIAGLAGNGADVALSVRNTLGQLVYATTITANANPARHKFTLPEHTPAGMYYAYIDDGISRVVRAFAVQ